MHTRALLSIALLLACLATAVLAAPDEARDESAEQERIVDRVKLFKFLDFKLIFGKHYLNPAEELARCRIFLANAFKVFIAWIRFIHRETTSYERITEMSDNTESELDRLYNHRTSDWVPVEQPVAKPQEVLDEAELEKQLEEIVKRKDDARLASIARGLEQPEQSVGRGPSLEDLAARPEERPVEDTSVEPESNNPFYEPPELTSHGADDIKFTLPPITDQEDWRPVRIDVGQLLNAIFKSLGDLISSVLRTYGDIANMFTNEYRANVARYSDETEIDDPSVDKVFLDHRDSNCISEVKNQGNCGSCYIFSTMAAIEYDHCMRTGERVHFSEQFVLDCGHRKHLKGCEGGQERDTINFMREFGLELLSNYPYVRRKETCPYADDVEPDKMGYLKVPDLGYNTILLSSLPFHLKKSPVLMGVHTGPRFAHYGGAIDSGELCDKKRGHAMLLVGHGRERGVEYWLFKNSHGARWGESGYYKLNKETGAGCLMDGIGWTVSRSVGQALVNSKYEAQPVEQRRQLNIGGTYSPPNKYPPLKVASED